VETGAEYSQGLTLLPAARYNDIGQKYQGPVVLVTDALCYSTTDIFAAGFQDNQIGKVLGVDESTGAGGRTSGNIP
jgi:C-terminal processing protease CtpA/Prc